MEKKSKRKPPINMLVWCCYVFVAVDAYVSLNRVINDIFMLLSIVMVIDGIYFMLVTRQVSVELDIDKASQKDEGFNLRVKVKNQCFFPIPTMYIIPKPGMRASLVEDYYIGLLLSGKEEVQHSVAYKANLCGLEEIGLEKVIFKSFFSFFQKEVVKKEKVRIKILPKIRLISNMEQLNHFLDELIMGSGKQIGEGSSTIGSSEVGYELRPYVQGDSQKLIHWKIAAYKEELLVRQRYSNNEKRNDVFFILSPFISSNSEEEAIVQDKLLTTFISLVGHYLEQGQKVRIAYYKDKEWQYKKIKNGIHLQQLQEDLGDYVCLKVEETITQRTIIKSLLSMIKDKSGIKILVSSYWTLDIEEFILNNQQVRQLPCIWTGSKLISILEEQSILSVWHMTDAYEMTPLVERGYRRHIDE